MCLADGNPVSASMCSERPAELGGASRTGYGRCLRVVRGFCVKLEARRETRGEIKTIISVCTRSDVFTSNETFGTNVRRTDVGTVDDGRPSRPRGKKT